MGWLLLTIFLGLMLFGAPITVALGTASLAGLFHAGFSDSLYIIPQQILDGVDKPALLAIPFFIMAGNLMNAAGLTDKIFNFAVALVGHFRAGLAQVNVIASLIFAGVSGAATADIAGLGTVEVKAMRERGYSPDFAAALTLATSVVGPIIPPSISLIVYAWLANTSVARLFLAGIIPGLLVGLAFMVFIRLLAIRYDFPREPKAGLRKLGASAVDGFAALVAPVIILGAILTGFATATEAGVLACGYSLLLGLLYRKLTWRKLTDALTQTAIITSVILMLIGFAQVMGWLLAIEQLPLRIGETILGATDDRHLFLLLVVVFLLVVGCFMEATPSKIILLPLLLPIVDSMGIDRVHFGLILTLALLIGITTPPLGIGLYVMVGISGLPMERLAVAVLPLLIPLVVVLLLITYVPALTLWLPNLVMGPG